MPRAGVKRPTQKPDKNVSKTVCNLALRHNHSRYFFSNLALVLWQEDLTQEAQTPAAEQGFSHIFAVLV
jgi:hypothetical protein